MAFGVVASQPRLCTQLRFAVQVAVKIPLVGRKLEKSMEADLAESIPELQRFTTTWIAENP